MIDVKDEILNGEPRYRGRDNQGNILFDDFIFEQITEVVQEATPLNKLLFDKLQKAIANEIKLSGSYTVPTIHGISDFVMPTVSSTDTKGFKIFYSGEEDGNWNGSVNVYDMFNGDGDSYMGFSKNSTNYINIETPYPIKIDSLKVSVSSAKVRLQVSDDGVNWLTASKLEQITTINKTIVSLAQTSSYQKFYKYFRIMCQNYSTDRYDWFEIYNDITINGLKVDAFDSVYMQVGEENDIMLNDNYYTGQIIKIETPADYIAYNLDYKIKVYGLDIKSISSEIPDASTKYKLVYDGNTFGLGG